MTFTIESVGVHGTILRAMLFVCYLRLVCCGSAEEFVREFGFMG